MKQKISIILAIIMCLPFFCGAKANAVEPRGSTLVQWYSADVERTDTGDLSIFFSIVATDFIDILGVSSIDVERKDGNNWVTEYTFTTTNTIGLQLREAIAHQATLDYTPLYPKREYRVAVNFIAQEGNVVATVAYITSPV